MKTFKQITPPELLAAPAGSIVRVTCSYRGKPDDVWTATLNNAEQREEGVYFGFVPASEWRLGCYTTRADSVRCTYGYIMFRDTPFDHGVQKVELEVEQ